jgi:hypothetical protein
MAELATACNAFFAECMSFLNSANEEPSYTHLTPTVVAMGASIDDAHATYQFIASLDSATASNVYTIFGTNESPMSWPAAYQCATPFGANTGGTNAAFHAIANNAALGFAEFDSWLSVGVTGGDAAGALSTIGLDFVAWNEATGLDTNDGAVFWMSPDAAPGGESVVGQVTVAADASGTVLMGMQVRYALLSQPFLFFFQKCHLPRQARLKTHQLKQKRSRFTQGRSPADSESGVAGVGTDWTEANVEFNFPP